MDEYFLKLIIREVNMSRIYFTSSLFLFIGISIW